MSLEGKTEAELMAVAAKLKAAGWHTTEDGKAVEHPVLGRRTVDEAVELYELFSSYRVTSKGLAALASAAAAEEPSTEDCALADGGVVGPWIEELARGRS